jgi:TolA-binding protein
MAACGFGTKESVSSQAYSNYKKGNYKTVLKLTSRLLNTEELHREKKAELLFLRGLSLEKLKKFDEAQKVYRSLLDDFSDTIYGNRAKEKLNEHENIITSTHG